MRRTLPILTLLGLLALPMSSAQASFSYYDPSLGGVTLLVATPVFSLQAQADPGSSLACTLSFEGQTVSMPYSAQQQGCLYAWPTPLAPGSYAASITVTSPGASPLVENLQFSVAQGAVAALGQPSLQSIEAQRVLDYVRQEAGLPAVGFDAGLQAASAAHAAYFVQNQGLYTASVSMHDEPSAQAPGYTGALPQDRDNAFSAVAGGSEEMVSGEPSGPFSLQGLFDTTFHRFGLLDPTLTAVGAGYVQSPLSDLGGQSAYVIDMDTGFDPLKTLSWAFPWNGETNVPVAFEGEEPDPLQGFLPASQIGQEPEAGYPVSLTFDPGQVQSVAVSQAVLYQGQTQVPAYLLDSTTYTDQSATYPGETMGTSVALFPKAPLAYQTTYAADFSGTLTLVDGQSQPFEQSWTFTTGAAPEVTAVYQDGGTLFVEGQNLSQSYVSTYWYPSGDVTVGNSSYQGDHLLAAPTNGPVTKVEVTDGSTGKVIGDFTVGQAPLRDTATSASSQYSVDADHAAGLVEGYPDGTFRPDASITGAQAIAMLYRAMGSPSTAGDAAVPGLPAWAEAPVAWAESGGIVTAQDGFAPLAPATRAQLATWLWRAFGLQPATAAPTFTDAGQIPSSFAGYVAAAAAASVVLGYPDGSFRPQAAVQRGAFAIWVWRLHMELIAPSALF